MGKGSVYEGKTFDEAVGKGLDDLGLKRAEAAITVVEEGKGGFLGFGARPFRVSVMRRPGGAVREPEETRERRVSSKRDDRRGGRDRDRGRGGRDRDKDRDKDREGKREGRGAQPVAAGADSPKADSPRGERRPGRADRKDDRREPRREGSREERAPRPQPVAAQQAAAEPMPRAAAPVDAVGHENGDEGSDAQRRRRRRGRRGGRGRRRGGEGAPVFEGGAEGAAPAFEPQGTEEMEFEDAAPAVAMSAAVPAPMSTPMPAPLPPAPAPLMMHEPEAPAMAGVTSGPPEPSPSREGRAPRPERPRHAPRESSHSSEPGMSTAELGETSRKLTEKLLGAMGFEATVTVKAEADRADVTVEVSQNDELLTGQKGEVRQAMQHLLNRFLNRGEGSRYHLQLEINDFWQRREIELETLARSMADEAVANRAEVVTEYLNSQERRIIHVTLREDSRVRTFALGTGMIKRVAVAPADFPERTGEEDAG